jgi:hypothetical protein
MAPTPFLSAPSDFLAGGYEYASDKFLAGLEPVLWSRALCIRSCVSFLLLSPLANLDAQPFREEPRKWWAPSSLRSLATGLLCVVG